MEPSLSASTNTRIQDTCARSVKRRINPDYCIVSIFSMWTLMPPHPEHWPNCRSCLIPDLDQLKVEYKGGPCEVQHWPHASFCSISTMSAIFGDVTCNMDTNFNMDLLQVNTQPASNWSSSLLKMLQSSTILLRDNKFSNQHPSILVSIRKKLGLTIMMRRLRGSLVVIC